METVLKRNFKDQLYAQFARLGKALANPHRLELLDLLAQGERTVEALAQEAGLPIANASQHLQVLRAAHLVTVRRAGLFAYYRLADERVLTVWHALRDLGEVQLLEVTHLVDTFLQDRNVLQAVSAIELQERLDDGGTIVLDVRPTVEYRAGHIPGARSIPIEELAARMEELPSDQTIIAYCRGPYCVYADEAVAVLQVEGFRAHRLEDGLPEWRARGRPVQFGEDAYNIITKL